MELSGNFRKSSGSFDKDVWKVPHAVGSPRERDSVTVRVPGTSANLGCGFDCIGMALDIWNELTVERAPRFEILIEGVGSATGNWHLLRDLSKHPDDRQPWLGLGEVSGGSSYSYLHRFVASSRDASRRMMVHEAQPTTRG